MQCIDCHNFGTAEPGFCRIGTAKAEALGLSNEQAAKNLGVDESTVSRIRHKFLASGSIEKKAYPKDKAYRKLTSVTACFALGATKTRSAPW